MCEMPLSPETENLITFYTDQNESLQKQLDQLESVENGITITTGIDTTGLNMTTPTPNASGASLSVSQIGTSFSLIATTINTLFGTSALPGDTITTTLTCVGRDSGARITIPLTIIKS